MADNQEAPVEQGPGEAAAAVANLHLDEVTGEKISKTELKRRQKAREKEAAKAKKASAQPAQEVSKKAAEAKEKDLNPNQVGNYCDMAYRIPRLTQVLVFRASFADD